MADNKTAGGKAPKSKSKSQVYKDLADQLKGKLGKDVTVKPKDVAAFFTALQDYIKKELGKKGSGVLALPGLVKMQRVTKPATKAGQRPNPFKPGEMMTVKARPARTVVKVRPLKNLKDLVS
jgi:nucleoid DNA-binding protein